MPDHDHIYETLPDGRQVCFECDAPKNPAAVALGRLGGRVRSPRKTEANRRNGKLGGRPRKAQQPTQMEAQVRT